MKQFTRVTVGIVSRISALLSGLVLLLDAETLAAEKPLNGFVKKQGRDLFPIGFYELPKGDEQLRELAQAGVNLLRCRNRADLDRGHSAGMLGGIVLPLQADEKGGESLRRAALEVKDHPALAVWEGPDEIVWNFTAYSGLHRNGTYASPDEWWRQTARAIDFSESEAAKILPALRRGCELVTSLDRRRHTIWINEASQSDMKFVREYLDRIDITGCDIYPVHDTNQKPWVVGDYTDRYRAIGRGKPVWMVLQGFSWNELKPPRDKALRYPTFPESRFMAYDAIVHGAKGILYWGSEFVPQGSPFRESLLALTRELAALQGFLTADDVPKVQATCLDANDRFEGQSRGIRCLAKRVGREWLVILVNEDAHTHMGVEVEGLGALNVRSLRLLYGDELAVVRRGGFVTRLRPLEVKVFASDRKWESSRKSAGDFGAN